MGWNYLGILLIVSLVLSAVGFYKYVYFLSIGYGFSVAGIGITLAVMSLAGTFNAGVQQYILFALLVIYGIRLSGFLLIREMKNISYRNTLQAVTGDEKKMPVFVKVAIWLCVGVLYVAQTSPVFFRSYNGGETSIAAWIGIVICVFAIILESVADKQKSDQKKVRPVRRAFLLRAARFYGRLLKE